MALSPSGLGGGAASFVSQPSNSAAAAALASAALNAFGQVQKTSQTAMIDAAFSSLDRNHDGVISQSEFAQAYQDPVGNYSTAVVDCEQLMSVQNQSLVQMEALRNNFMTLMHTNAVAVNDTCKETDLREKLTSDLMKAVDRQAELEGAVKVYQARVGLLTTGAETDQRQIADLEKRLADASAERDTALKQQQMVHQRRMSELEDQYARQLEQQKRQALEREQEHIRQIEHLNRRNRELEADCVRQRETQDQLKQQHQDQLYRNEQQVRDLESLMARKDLEMDELRRRPDAVEFDAVKQKLRNAEAENQRKAAELEEMHQINEDIQRKTARDYEDLRHKLLIAEADKERPRALSTLEESLDIGIPPKFWEVIRQIDTQGWLDCRWNSGYTLLHWAAEHNKPRLVAYCIRKGANPYDKDGKLKTALDYATDSRSSEALAALRNV